MDEVLKDNIACGAVLATMLLTVVCGAIVVEAAPDAYAQMAQASMEIDHD